MFPSSRPQSAAFSAFVTFILFVEIFAPFSFAQSFSSANETGVANAAARQAVASFAAEIAAAKSASFAATATPTPAAKTTSSSVVSSGSCAVSRQTGSEVKLIWDSTLGFVGNEVNSLNDSALKTSDSKAFTNATGSGQVVVNNYISTGTSASSTSRVPVSDVARLLGKSVEEVANDFAVDSENGTISMQMFQAEVDKNPSLSGFLGKFTSLLGSSVSSSIDNPSYTNYKIKLPNSKTLSLSDVFALQDLNGETDACLLDNSFIQGRVSYVGQLDRDLSVGFDGSSTTLKSNQHLTSESTIAAMSLNGGSSIVVPKRFENLVSALSTIMTWDTVLTMGETVYMIAQYKDYSKRITDTEPKKLKWDTAEAQYANNRNVLFSRQTVYSYDQVSEAELFDELGTTLPAGITSSKFGRLNGLINPANPKASQLAIFDLLQGSQGKTKQQFLDELVDIGFDLEAAKSGASASTVAALESRKEAIGQLRDLVMEKVPDSAAGSTNAVTNLLNKADSEQVMNNVYSSYGFGAPASEYLKTRIARDDYKYVYQHEYDVLSGGIMENQDAIRKVIESKLISNFYFGFAWLGAGRSAISLARGITLSSTGRLSPDNYLTIYINRNDVLSDFRKSTDWALSGKLSEILATLTDFGAPAEAFGVGPMIIINSPYTTTDTQSSLESSTAVEFKAPSSGYSSSWQVTSNWKGKSDATVFEDVRDDPKYARMPLFVSNMTLGTSLNQNDLGQELYGALGLIAPIISFKAIGARAITDSAIVPISRILIYDFYVKALVDPTAFSKSEVCSDERIRNYITEYAVATGISQASNLAQISLGAEETSWVATLSKKMGSSLSNKAINAINTVSGIISPADLLKNYYASQALEYARTCKDTAYTIVGFQTLDKKPKNSLSSLTQKLTSLSSSGVVGNLSFGSALAGVGNSVSADAKTEIINMRMTMDSQSGMIRPSDLYYLHLDGASEVSWGIYSKLESGGCFRKCQDGTTMAVCETASGTYVIDKATGAKTQISDSDRALLSTLMQDIAKTILPNTLISAQLACGSGDVIMHADTNARMQASSGCATTECMISQLANLAGKSISGGYISDVLGEVSAVKTTTGLALFEKGKPIRFIYTAGTETSVTKISPLGPGYYDLGGTPISENSTQVTSSDIEKGALTTTTSKVGTEVTSPSVGAQAAVESGTLTSTDALSSAMLNIKGDASVTLSGFTSGTNFEDVDAGELESIVFKRGRIEYDKANNRLVAALYILGEADFAKSVKGVSAVATKNVNENGTNNAIQVNFTSKSGMEDSVAELNNALAQVQGSGGMQILETANYIYYFTKNAAGEDILKVCDKKTSTCKEYRITGSISSDGKTITVPTESGTFSIGFGTNAATGYPEINVNGPDGFAELATLLAAKGQNGIFVFDPLTGLAKILNGQDLSLSSDFASKGMSFYGTSDGTKGVAGNNYVGLARSSGALSSSSASPFSVPSVPVDNLPVALLMVVSLLGAVVAVRAYKD